MFIQVFVALFSTDYLSKVFDMGEEEHDIILQKVQESKVSHSESIQMLSYQYPSDTVQFYLQI